MPTPVLLLLLALLCPLAACGVLLFAGRRMGPLAGWVGVASMAAAFLLTLGAIYFWLQTGMSPDRMEWGYGRNPIVLLWTWAPGLKIGVYIDSLTLGMFLMVTLVAALVNIYSIGYMHGEAEFSRYFAYLGLFCFSMLGLLLAVELVQLFIFWELVGLCSYLLIGFWHEKPTASNAAIKAFVVNRVGDAAFLIALGILFYHVESLSLPALWVALGAAGTGAAAGGMSPMLLSIVGILLFTGAAAKSAQFPLHGWLPSAMEGPTPVSALIHAATMVAAGVYLMARVFPILTPDAKLFIAVTGVVTLSIGALIACVQSDIKRVLAFSTMSQLGYMMLAIGVGSWIGAIFHLLTHAFFKSLLFLGAGSVIHAANHEQEMGEFGGLMYKIPWTASTFAIAAAAISGMPFFSGFYSKEMILGDAGHWSYLMTSASGQRIWQLLFIIPLVVAGLTAFYMTRCWMLTFWGRSRNTKIHDTAAERPILWMPMLLLAVLSIFGGTTLGMTELLRQAPLEATHYCQTLLPLTTGFQQDGTSDAAAVHFAGFDSAWPLADTTVPSAAESSPASVREQVDHQVHRWAMWALAVGLGMGFLLYLRGDRLISWMTRLWPFSWIHAWLYNEMYFDELYQAIPVEITLMLGSVARWIDQRVIDGAVLAVAAGTRGLSRLVNISDRYVVDGVVQGMADLAVGIGQSARRSQNGRIRVYIVLAAAMLTLGTAAIVAAMIL